MSTRRGSDAGRTAVMMAGLGALLAAALAAVLIAAAGCAADDPTGPDPSARRMDDSGATAAGIEATVEANNRFALEVYGALGAAADNLFLSPYSLSAALAMTYEGARGRTAEQLQAVFRFPQDDAIRRGAFAALHNRLNPDDVPYELRVANALWAQQGYAFRDEYLSLLGRYYAAEAAEVDFQGDLEAARATINDWVATQTRDRIPVLFPAGSLAATTRLVLTNAIYFKGRWARRFDVEATRDADFHTATGGTVRVPTMGLTGTAAQFPYGQTPGAQVLELPYEGQQLSMLVVLPAPDSLAWLEGALSTARLAAWRAALSELRVDVYLPRFGVETELDLGQTLQGLGATDAFAEGLADFSGMDGTRDLVLQAVVHRAVVEVSEAGTEAAAATGVSVGVTSLPPPAPVFRADRPFLFLIQHVDTGAVLFLGRVTDPRG